MMSRSFLLGLFGMTALFFSCEEKRPAGVLSQDQMVVAMTDFYLKEAKINTLSLTPDSATVLMRYYKEQYARKNGLADSVLDKSYQFYLENPTLLSKIYDRVIDSLALREQKAGGTKVAK